VKDRLVFEQKKIAAVEERRKAQENRKFSKALKSHKAKEKGDDRKRTLDAVKEWQKQSKAKRCVGVECGDSDGLCGSTNRPID
jgi:rRNA-processing protein EBP2